MIVKTVQLLTDLVAIASTTEHEQAIKAYIATACALPGVEVTTIQNSVVAHIPGRRPHEAFLVASHIDTVRPNGAWDTDPYVLTPNQLDSDKLHGLGASDDKSAIAVMIGLVQEYSRRRPPVDLYLAFTEGEEDDNVGARRVARWLAPRIATCSLTGGLILEPTDGGDFIGIGHRNGLTLDVIARGPGGHGSQKLQDREAALEKISYFVSDALPKVRNRWVHTYMHPVLGSPTLNVTKLESGNVLHNVIPDQVVLTIDLRSTPSLDIALPAELALLEDTYDVKIVSPRKPDPAICPADSHIIRTVQRVLPDTPIRSFAGATDLPYFLAYGLATLILGPGDTTAMHQPNEWVRQTDMKRCKTMIKKIISGFAVNTEEST